MTFRSDKCRDRKYIAAPVGMLICAGFKLNPARIFLYGVGILHVDCQVYGMGQVASSGLRFSSGCGTELSDIVYRSKCSMPQPHSPPTSSMPQPQKKTGLIWGSSGVLVIFFTGDPGGR